MDGNNWRLHLTANGGFSVGGPVANGDLTSMGTPECEHGLGERGWSLQQQEEDEVTESKIRRFVPSWMRRLWSSKGSRHHSMRNFMRPH